MNPVAIVRQEVKRSGGPAIRRSLLFWCPGCDQVHRVVFWQADGYTGPVWEWDLNLEAPTVSPSILCHGSANGGNCHSFLRNGRWQFLDDSHHDLAGQTVDMVPLPDWLVR